jgi:hypothetical protein
VLLLSICGSLRDPALTLPYIASHLPLGTNTKVNHLAPFLLTELLLPALAKAKSGRIVHVSSAMHFLGVLDRQAYSVEDKNLNPQTFRRYSPSVVRTKEAIGASLRKYRVSRILFNGLGVGNVTSDTPPPPFFLDL